jgi:hypothetical protein
VVPGVIVASGRATLMVTVELPAPNDGGAEEALVPQ